MQRGRIEGAGEQAKPVVLTSEPEQLQAYCPQREERVEATEAGALPAGWMPEADRQLALLREHTREESDRAVVAALDQWTQSDGAISTALIVGGLALMLVPALWVAIPVLFYGTGLDLVGAALWVLATGGIAGIGWWRRSQQQHRRAVQAAELTAADDSESQKAFYAQEVLIYPELAEVAALWRTRGIPLRHLERALLRRTRLALEDRELEMRLARAGLHPEVTHERDRRGQVNAVPTPHAERVSAPLR